ncbi:hypothetical protein Tco_0257910, partial [Tanacetum coccineum]
DKVFNPGILASPFLSHWDKITSDFSENPMMMYGGDIPLLDVPCLHFYPHGQLNAGIESSYDCPDFEDSRARGFVHLPLDLQYIAHLYWESDILNLID